MSDQPLVRKHTGDFHWQQVDTLAYKEDANAPFREVTRQVLFDTDDPPAQLRYFEVAPGGWTTLERHEHTHVVIPIRGHGRALIVDRVVPLALHDMVFVPSWGWHQFRAPADEPFGFLCAVVVDRDRPVRPTEADLEALRRDPEIAAFIRL